MTSIKNYIRDAVNQYSCNVFAVNHLSGEKTVSITYDVFFETVQKISKSIFDLCIFEKKQIGILSENKFEWAIAFFSIANADQIAVPLDFNLNAKELSQFVNHSKIQLLFASSKNMTKAKELLELCPILEKVVIIDQENDDKTNLKIFNINSIETEQIPLKEVYSGDDLKQMVNVAAIFYTSGTTGNSKGICLTHENLISQFNATIKEVLKSNQPNVLVSVLPLFHVFEFTHGLLTPFMTGSTIHYMEDVSPENLKKVIKESHATVLLLVPLALERIKQGILRKVSQASFATKIIFKLFCSLISLMPIKAQTKFGKKIFHKVHYEFGGKLKMIVSGGAALDPAIEKFYRILGFVVFQGYGLTECSPVLTTNRPDHYTFGSVGLPFEGTQIKIDQKDGSNVGEVLAKGPGIMKGYYNNSVATNEAFTPEGWFKTGDIGQIDKNGFLKLFGRYKNVIVTANGENIYPEELETIFKENSFIQDLVIFSGADIGQKENLSVIVFPNLELFSKSKKFTYPNEKQDIEKFIKNIFNEINKTVSISRRIQNIYFTYEDFVRTSTKKIKRKDTVMKFFSLANNLSLDKEKIIDETISNIDEKHYQYFKDLYQAYDIKIDKKDIEQSFDVLGVDSLLKAEIIKSTYKQFKKEFSPSDYSEINSTKDLIAKIELSAIESDDNRNVQMTINFREYDHYINKPYIVKLLASLFGFSLNLFFKSYFKLIVDDQKNLLTKLDNTVIVANHVSHLDTMCIYMSLPARIRANTYVLAAKDYFFNNPIKSWFFGKLLNSIPMDRKLNQYESIQLAQYILSKGKNLIIFPEGTRSPTGKLLKFKPGTAQLVTETKCNIIGLYFPDNHKLFPKGAFLPKPGVIRANIFQPDLSISQNMKNDYKLVKELTDLLEKQYRHLEVSINS